MCVTCLRCVAVCPAKACNTATETHVAVDAGRCVGCGACVTACPHGARYILDDANAVRAIFAEKQKSIVIADASLPAFFPKTYLHLNAYLHEQGAEYVLDARIGLALASSAYANAYAAHGDAFLLSSHCPAVVSYVERYTPLYGNVLPVLSPVAAACDVVRREHPEHTIIVLSPCVARKRELPEGVLSLTVASLTRALHASSINLASYTPRPYDTPPLAEGALLPLDGGFAKSTGGIEAPVIALAGEERVYPKIDELARTDDTLPNAFVDCLSCPDGCLGGHGGVPQGFFEKYNAIITRHERLSSTGGAEEASSAYTPADANYHKEYTYKSNASDTVDDDVDEQAIRMVYTRLFGERREIDCGSCGYATCREMAHAIAKGKSRYEYCRYYRHFEQYKEIVEHANSAIIKTDLDGAILFINDFAKRLFEYDDEDILGKNLLGTIFPQTDTETRSRIGLAKQESGGSGFGSVETSIHKGYENITKSGKRIFVTWTNFPLINAKAGTHSILYVGTDITERKEWETILEGIVDKMMVAEQTLNAVFENVYETIVLLDEEGNITRANSRIFELFGVTFDKAEGMNFAQAFLCPDTPCSAFKEHLDAVLHGESRHSEWKGHHLTKDTLLDIDLFLRRIKIRDGGRILATIRDITSAKQREARIRQSEQVYKTLAQNIPDTLTFLVDEEGVISVAEGKALDEIGYPAAYFRGTRLSDTFPSSVIGDVSALIKKTFETGERQFLEYELSTSFGKNWFHGITTLIAASDALPKTVLFITRDITERKIYEQQIMQYAADLKNSNEELEQFAYVASHDLQEPLRTIASFLQLLETRFATDLPEKAQNYIERAVNGAKRMQRMIRDLLSYSRVARKMNMLAECDTGVALENALENVKGAIADHNAKVTHTQMPVLVADESLLTSLFQNLIGNALKYSKSDVAPIIHIAAEEKEDVWEFSVADNGIGIKQEYSERIFEIFQRLHSRDTYSGTGIGLAMCKKIVDRFTGRIWVASKPDVGSTFYFTIPK